MSYFVVFQNKTFEEEKEGQYLWAPQKNNQGRGLFHWESMMRVRPGDIIFSMFRQHLVSVNLAKEQAIEAPNPFLNHETTWERTGWLVKAEYNELPNPVSIKEHREDILKLCPPKYSPFTRTGGGTQGYLFEIDETFGEYLLSLARKNNYLSVKEINEEEFKEIKEIEDLLDQTRDQTENERIVKGRIGQGLFKQKLLSRSSECEICGLDISSLLIASHCKPWSQSDNYERLDADNGLLLCANHDGVFDKGLISFSSDGQILISSKVEQKNYPLLNLNQQIRINITANQKVYLEWHRANKLQ
ncbi:hypothetical protein BN1080_00402 [Planococcus massiliensis]|uniref:HNH nuclease domain-containing protein n=1 Tax=Planococcus massiliensis TaxID=1499687 RepID=A0A098EKF9_9BACL|nr:HNH endonuclease [Planococcus massiliensis]CEG21491.1 hypothetical protein BN1080_00402 [Planococcus massiliensis]